MASRRQKYIGLLTEYFEWTITLLIALIVAIAGLGQSLSSEVVTSATLLVLGAFSLGAIRDRATAYKLARRIDDLPEQLRLAVRDDPLVRSGKASGLVEVLPHAIDYDWLPLIGQAQDVTIAKLKLNFTENPAYLRAFRGVLQRGGAVTIVLSDPRAPAMWLRYMEEPHHVTSLTETAWIHGLEELAAEVARLRAWREGLIRDGVSTDRLFIGVFPHYPTQAFYRFDQRLYVFHYPFLERGFHAPAFVFGDPSTEPHQFLLRCMKKVVDNAIELDDAIVDEIDRLNRHGQLSDDLVAISEVCIVREPTQSD